MDVAALAQSILSQRTAATYQEAQVSILKKAMETESAGVTRLVDSMSLPLATEGSLGRHLNTYA